MFKFDFNQSFHLKEQILQDWLNHYYYFPYSQVILKLLYQNLLEHQEFPHFQPNLQFNPITILNLKIINQIIIQKIIQFHQNQIHIKTHHKIQNKVNNRGSKNMTNNPTHIPKKILNSKAIHDNRNIQAIIF